MNLSYELKQKLSNLQMDREKIVSFILFFIFIIATFLYFQRYINHEDFFNNSDSSDYTKYAYNLYTVKTFSDSSKTNFHGIIPDAYREPLYPIVLASAFYTFDTKIKNIDRETFFRRLKSPFHDNQLYKILKPYLLLNIVMYIITGLLMIIIANHFLKNLLLASITPYFLFLYSTYGYYKFALNSESLATLLFTLNVLYIVKVYKNQNTLNLILSGISLSLLTLTKSYFMYFFIPLFFYYFKLLKTNNVQIQKNLLAFSVGFLIILAPWIGRNLYHFNKIILTERSGDVIYIRSEFDRQITKCEYLKLLNINTKECQYENLNNFNRKNLNGYHKKVTDQIQEYKNSLGESYNQKLKNISIEYFKHNALKHILVSIPLTYSGNIITTKKHLVYISSFIFLFYLFCIVLSFKRKELLPLTFLCIYNILFISFFTISFQRYHFIALPVMIISAVYVINEIIKYIRNRFFENLRNSNTNIQ